MGSDTSSPGARRLHATPAATSALPSTAARRRAPPQAPLLLELGVEPAVAAATSQATISSSATAAIVYLSNGAAPGDYAAVMALLGVLGTLAGQLGINALVRRTGRSSLLVFVLTGMLVVATCAAVAVAGMALAPVAADPSLLFVSRAAQLCDGRGRKTRLGYSLAFPPAALPLPWLLNPASSL